MAAHFSKSARSGAPAVGIGSGDQKERHCSRGRRSGPPAEYMSTSIGRLGHPPGNQSPSGGEAVRWRSLTTRGARSAHSFAKTANEWGTRQIPWCDRSAAHPSRKGRAKDGAPSLWVVSSEGSATRPRPRKLGRGILHSWAALPLLELPCQTKERAGVSLVHFHDIGSGDGDGGSSAVLVV